MNHYSITSPDDRIATPLRQKIDQKTKPLGSLGLLERTAFQLGMIQQSLEPHIDKPTIMVFAGDHGIAKTGLVNPYPQSVTAQMVLNFCRGGAAINVLCRQHKIDLQVIDAGVASDLPKDPALICAKIRKGTHNYLEGPAMSTKDCQTAMERGFGFIDDLHQTGCNTVGFGEMGIGNSTSAALMMAALTGLPLEDCVGRGTGLTDAQLETKLHTAKRALELHIKEASPRISGLEALHIFGGFELAMMCGAMLGAAARRMAILIDGFIVSAVLLVAKDIDPLVMHYCLFAHESQEKGHRKLLSILGGTPLLQLDLRLGEGTGAALALPLLQSATAFLKEMASFESAGVSTATTITEDPR
jgi:nicotinate-nucleotide--dimethylbenzimidazole phosphoribosyltransferase